jgi:endonuclease/exonuclease/phosphatase family metal-dependent hydrolase
MDTLAQLQSLIDQSENDAATIILGDMNTVLPELKILSDLMVL